ncbi:hypothetical protein COCSUDRAFT_47669, partial [Coccomyxa subellipsoidea C-169]
MEATPYALPVRHAWWTDSTPDTEKENRPHQISLLSLQSHKPPDPISLQSCAPERFDGNGHYISQKDKRERIASEDHGTYQGGMDDIRQPSYSGFNQALEAAAAQTSTAITDMPAPSTPTGRRRSSMGDPSSPPSKRPMFATVYGSSPGNTPMPRSSSSVLRDLPIAPKKPVSPFNEPCRTLKFNTGMPPCMQSCPGRAQDSARRHAAGNSHPRVRVRRALDLQTPGAQRGLDCSFASPFEPSHSLSSQSPDPCTPRASAPASVEPGEQLCSLDETSDWQQG